MPKIPFSVILDPDIAEQCRRAGWWVGRGVSLNSIVEAGGEEEVEKLEKQHGVFPPRGAVELRKRSGEPYGKRGEKGRKQKVIIRCDPDLAERLRNASAALGVEYSNLMANGIERVLRRLQRQYNDGEPFPPKKRDAV